MFNVFGMTQVLTTNVFL